MGVITYIAVDRGNLASGHSAGTSYQIEIPFAEWTPSFKEKKIVKRSISGKIHTTFHHRRELFRFATSPTNDATKIALLEEWLSSVAGGEAFSIDLYGSIVLPQNPIQFTIDGSASSSRTNQTYLNFSGQVEKA